MNLMDLTKIAISFEASHRLEFKWNNDILGGKYFMLITTNILNQIFSNSTFD